MCTLLPKFPHHKLLRPYITRVFQELMKMMGLKTWMVWAGWTLNGLMVYIVVCAVITFLLCTDFDQGAVIACVHFTVVFCLYIFFCLASIFFCFAISSLFLKRKSQICKKKTLKLNYKPSGVITHI